MDVRVSKWLSILAALVMACAGVTVVATPAQANGCITPAAGTAADPFLIQNAGNLNCLYNNASYYWAHTPAAYHFRLTVDLDMTGTTWTHGIGDSGTLFTGVFDGAGHTVSNLTITQTASGVAPISGLGFFGVTASISEITNLKLNNVTVNATHTGSSYINATGALVGSNSGYVSNVWLFGSLNVTAADAVGGIGGLIGNNNGGTIDQVVADVHTSVTGISPSRLGGLIGRNNASTVSNCASYGSVSSTALSAGNSSYMGGLIGDAQASTVTDCLTMAALAANNVGSNNGAFIGNADASIIADSFWDDTMSPSFPLAIGTPNATTVTHLNAKGTGDLQHYVTYVDPANVATPWNMGNTYESSPTHIWGLCYGAVAPFLQALTYTSPCLPEPTVTLPVTTLAAGQSLSVSGVNFMPNTRIRITLYSTPIILSTVSADGNGAFSTTVTIPTDTAVGTHTLEVFDEIEWTKINTTITVNAQLAQTGAPRAMDPLIGFSLLLTGVVIALYARRRYHA